jgi:TolA-binding protein
MSKLKLVIVATTLLGSSSAFADAKYKRAQDVKIDVKLSDRVKPIQQKPQNKSEFKPELSADAVLSIEGLVSNIRNEQEAILAKLIDSTPDSEVEEKSDYYFRLGELYAKQQRLFRLKSAEAAIAVDKAKTPQAKQQAQAAAKKAQDTAKMYLLKAVKTYKGLTDNDAFRNYPKMDMALFYYGYTLQGGGYMKEARAVYDKLLKNYPNSKYVPEAHLAFADYYFEQGQLADAEARYKQVLKFPKSSALALPGCARDVLPGRAGHEERQEERDPQPRREEGLRPRVLGDRQGRQGLRRVQARRHEVRVHDDAAARRLLHGARQER